MKICSRCKVEKPVEQFYKDRRIKDGLDSQCKSCTDKTSVEYCRNNKDKRRGYYKEYNVRNRRHIKECKLKRKYGITLEEYEDMVKAQDSKCCLCRKFEEGLHIDHCRESGKVRGLLCGSCNRGIGLLKHNPNILRRAADYVEA